MNIIYKSHGSSFRKAYLVRSAWFNWALSTQQIQMPRPFESQRILVQCHPVWRSCPAMRLPTSSCVGRHKLGNHLTIWVRNFREKKRHNPGTTLGQPFQPWSLCTSNHAHANIALQILLCPCMQAMASKVPEFVAPLGSRPKPPPGPPSYSRTSRRRWRPADADPEPRLEPESIHVYR